MLVNSFTCYETCLLSKGASKKNILSQYEFRKVIALAWIDPQTYWKSYNRKRANNEANENTTRDTRSNKIPKTSKATCITDDSFETNSNMAHRMSKSVEHEL